MSIDKTTTAGRISQMYIRDDDWLLRKAMIIPKTDKRLWSIVPTCCNWFRVCRRMPKGDWVTGERCSGYDAATLKTLPLEDTLWHVVNVVKGDTSAALYKEVVGRTTGVAGLAGEISISLEAYAQELNNV